MFSCRGFEAPLKLSPVAKAGGLPSPLPTLSSSSSSSSSSSFFLKAAFYPPKRGVVVLNREPPAGAPNNDPPAGAPNNDPDAFEAPPNKLPDPNMLVVPAAVTVVANLNPPPNIELPDYEAAPKSPPLVVAPAPRLPNKLPPLAFAVVVVSFF